MRIDFDRIYRMDRINDKKSILALMYVPFFLTPFVWTTDMMYAVLVAKTFYFYAVSVAIFAIAALLILFSKRSANPRLNIIDVAILSFWFYILIRVIFTEYTSLTNAQFIIQTFLISHYFIIKAMLEGDGSAEANPALKILAASFLAAGFFQAIYGLLQLYGFNPGYPTFQFKVVGAIGNPNSYAGFLVSVLPFALGFYLFMESKHRSMVFLKYLGLLTTLAIVLVLPVTYTRSAWIAGAVGLGMIYVVKHELWFTAISVLNNKIKIVTTLAAAFFLLIAAGISLYTMKPDSAFGRLFIWKITANL